MGSLDQKRALVTAGAQGIGMAISRELLDQGCNVAVHYYMSSEGAAEIEKYGSSLSRTCGIV